MHLADLVPVSLLRAVSEQTLAGVAHAGGLGGTLAAASNTPRRSLHPLDCAARAASLQ